MIDFPRLRTIACLVALAVPATAAAQGGARPDTPFEPALIVNERAVTDFELDQRALLLAAFGAGGDLRALAREQLIDERLQLQAADRLEIEVTDAQVAAGVTEFATRRELDPDQVLGALTARGVAPQTFDDFVRAGLAWRGVVQARFRRIATPSESDLDAALDLAASPVQESVLMQEIAMPFEGRSEEEVTDLARRLSRELNRGGNFAAAVARHSSSASKARGGRLDWLAASNLPPAVAGQILALQPGEVSAPIAIAGGVTILKLLDIRQETRSVAESSGLTVSYSQIIIPLATSAGEAAAAAARRQAEKIRSETRLCSDLDRQAADYGVGSGRSAAIPVNAVPADIAATLAGMTPGDIEILSDRRGVVVLMLCARSGETSPEDREALRLRLFNERIATLAQGYLQELRGDAVIEER